MAHAQERRTQLRGLYVYKRLPMESACAAVHVPRSTANRWKQEAKAAGDDWDSARAAVAMGDDSFKQLGSRLIEDFLHEFQATMQMVRQNKELGPQQRTQMLTSLADSFNKTMSSFRKLAPELNRHAVALDALQRLASFAQQRYPHNVPALLEMLEPFGEELAKAYG